MNAETPSSLPLLSDWEQVPVFPSLAHERFYWDQHQIDPLLLHNSLARSDTQEASLLQLRLDPRFLSRLKRMARLRYIDLPSMLRLWLMERLEREVAETYIQVEQAAHAEMHPRGVETTAQEVLAEHGGDAETPALPEPAAALSETQQLPNQADLDQTDFQ